MKLIKPPNATTRTHIRNRAIGKVAKLVLMLLSISHNSAYAESPTAGQHEVAELKVTILSTMLSQFGIGEWGFAALIEVDDRKILFDTGLRPDTVIRNAELLGLDLSEVEDVVLSHHHVDHTGGLLHLRRAFRDQNSHAFSRTHVSDGIFWERPGASPERSMPRIRDEYMALGGQFIEYSAAAQIAPGVWLSGPIPRPHAETNYGTRVGGRMRIGTTISPNGAVDDVIPESSSLVINTASGVVVVSGCGHAGMINTLENALNITKASSVNAAIGGFHLLYANDTELEWAAKHLVELGIKNFIGAHCTGLEPVYRFRELAHLSRKTAVVGAVGASFTLDSGINALSLAN
jgi:7,8-dihydropterin-6-yl-methyl-4-(beta-D-ribofuranosyl)aminobenzene 5'-phosphate synthase